MNEYNQAHKQLHSAVRLLVGPGKIQQRLQSAKGVMCDMDIARDLPDGDFKERFEAICKEFAATVTVDDDKADALAVRIVDLFADVAELYAEEDYKSRPG